MSSAFNAAMSRTASGDDNALRRTSTLDMFDIDVSRYSDFQNYVVTTMDTKDTKGNRSKSIARHQLIR